MDNNIKGHVGIITVHESNNCGALLQAFALQTVLEKLGYYAEFIDHNRFVTSKGETDHRIVSKKKKKTLGVLFSQAKGLYAIKKDGPLKNKACTDFRNAYLHISKRKYTEITEIQNEPPKYDAYICGSDQIWNPERFINSSPFFLSFVSDNSIKISYAPSLGVSVIPDHLQDEYRNLIQRLDYVSVREEDGVDLISNITKKDVACVLDPTFLLEKESWLSIAKKERITNEKYLFCYFLNYMSAYRIRKELNEYATRNKLKVVMFQAKCASIDANWMPAYGLGPSEFLSAIEHAELIITDSFHGTALSIKLEKNFYVYSAESDLPFASRFSRITNILKKCDLCDRTLDIGKTIIDKEINYHTVDALLQSEIEHSIGFLKYALSNVHKNDTLENTINLPYDRTNCYGCSLCTHVCNRGALKMTLDEDGFYRPTYQKELCVNCGLCENMCPALHMPDVKDGSMKESYAAWNRDELVQIDSSSGGVFSSLAEHVIKHGGIVIGAAISKENVVQHVAIDNLADIKRCRGSKYAQSSIDGVYEIIAKALNANRQVLFTGTGCQTAAIRSFFGENENLFICDVVCHGVGSPGIFKDYLTSIEQQSNKRINHYCFRDESMGWNRPCVKIDFDDGSTDKHRWYKDMYILAFSKNKILSKNLFEKEYKVRVNYSTFESNEDMYTKLMTGAA